MPGPKTNEMQIFKSLIKLTFVLFMVTQYSFAQNPEKQSKEAWSGKITKKLFINYLVYLPKDYNKNSKEMWPVIFFLHGSGERGSDLELVKKNGLPKLVEHADYPFIVISPQCPEYGDWDLDALNSLYGEILKKYQVDQSRVYLTGLSMGGYGTWAWAIDSPDKFAAIAPVCGGGKPWRASKIKDLPVWAFHGLKDDIVPVTESEKMVNALKKINGKAKLTIYPEADHDSWTLTYSNPELYKWFLEQRILKSGGF
jgi:predicted peptidase